MRGIAHQPIPTPAPDQAERMPYLVTTVPRSDSLVPPPPPSYPRNMSTRTPCHVREQQQQLRPSGPVVHARPNSFTTSKPVADVYSYEYEIATPPPHRFWARSCDPLRILCGLDLPLPYAHHNPSFSGGGVNPLVTISTNTPADTALPRYQGKVHSRPVISHEGCDARVVEVWDEPSLDRSGRQLRALGRVSELHGAAAGAG
jgi:hypothetical protein